VDDGTNAETGPLKKGMETNSKNRFREASGGTKPPDDDVLNYVCNRVENRTGPPLTGYFVYSLLEKLLTGRACYNLNTKRQSVDSRADERVDDAVRGI